MIQLEKKSAHFRVASFEADTRFAKPAPPKAGPPGWLTGWLLRHVRPAVQSAHFRHSASVLCLLLLVPLVPLVADF